MTEARQLSRVSNHATCLFVMGSVFVNELAMQTTERRSNCGSISFIADIYFFNANNRNTR